MNDNYLWDRTGEPDADVQQLEELLSSLRYQPRALEIPATISIGRKRTFFPLAIAAAIALLMIGAGLWLRFANSNPGPIQQAYRNSQPSSAPSQEMPGSPQSGATLSEPPVQTVNLPKHRKPTQTLVSYKPRRSIEPPAPALTEQELAQKEQVLVALRLVSAKLNLAQRKSQGLPQVNAIRNHKIG
jgi:hypothetical protein